LSTEQGWQSDGTI